MHKPLRVPEFWHVSLDGKTISHIVAEKLIKHRSTGNAELYDNLLSLLRIA